MFFSELFKIEGGKATISIEKWVYKIKPKLEPWKYILACDENEEGFLYNVEDFWNDES